MTTHTPYTPFIRGRAVDLAAPEMEDAEPLARWLNDPDVWQSFARLWPTNVEGERQWIAGQASRRDEINLIIFEKAGGRPVGLVGLGVAVLVEMGGRGKTAPQIPGVAVGVLGMIVGLEMAVTVVPG